MKNGKIFFLFLGVFLLSGCSFFGGGENVQPEAALPKDSFAVMALDYSDKDQRAQFEKLVERFPKNGLLQELIGREFDVFKPILKDQWKIVLGVKAEEKNFEIYLAGKFAQADKLADILDKELGKQKEGEGIKYWLEDGVFVVRDDEFFILAQNLENLKAAMERLSDDDGFGQYPVPELKAGNLGYIFADIAKAKPLIDAFYDEMAGTLKNTTDGMERATVIFSANEKGLVFDSRTDMKKGVENPYLVTDYVPALFKKIPGNGIITFGEQGSLKPILEVMSGSFGTSFDQVLEEIADFAEVEDGYALAVFDSPVAIALSYVDQFYPAIAIYLDLEADEVEAGRKIALAADQYVDEVLKELAGFLVSENPSVQNIFRKEPVVIKGGAMHRVSLDLTAMSDEDLAAINVVPGINIQEMKVEFYYGVTGDNVFVFGLYPGFDEAYGTEILAEDENLKEALKNLDLGFSISFFQTAPLLKLADKYFEVVPHNGVDYKSIRDSVATVKYGVSSNEKVSDSVFGKFLILIEEN